MTPSEVASISRNARLQLAGRGAREWVTELDSGLESAADRLHGYLVRRHWTGQALVGPDPIGKINWRITRFVRGYTRFLPWRDQNIFLQSQGYWIQANLSRHRLTGDDACLAIVEKTADGILHLQRPDGGWNYTLRERRHLVGSPEGTWAGLGLLAAYRQMGNPRYLVGAQKWYEFQVNQMGFAKCDDGVAPNFYDRPGKPVPNVAAMCLRYCLELKEASGDQRYLEHADGLRRFISRAQMGNGELPYVFQHRPHFQCFQYNAYQFLDLAAVYRHDPDPRVWEMMQDIARFLTTGVSRQNGCRFNCFKDTPEVNYWNAALASALRTADELQLGDYSSLSQYMFRRLLSRQRRNGGFEFSTEDYRILRDRRSYPRPQVMILVHLYETMPATRGPQ